MNIRRLNILKYLSIAVFILTASLTFSQSTALANQYYQSGEYEKAAKIYKSLYQSKNNNDYYFNKYMESLMAYDAYDIAEKAIKEEIKKRPNETQLYVYYGDLYEKKGEEDKAEKEYKKAIDKMPNNSTVISKIGSSFARLGKEDLAIAVYEKGQELIKDPNLYAYNLAILYQRKGMKSEMIDSYLNSIPKFKDNINSLINTLQRTLENEDYKMLQEKIYVMIKEKEPSPQLYEVLQWTFIHNKEYDKAFRQARSYDRWTEGNGEQVLRMGDIAYNDKDYETAIEAYDYVVEKGEFSSFYLEAKRGVLNSKRRLVLLDVNHTKADLSNLEAEYNSFLNSFGKNRETAVLMNEFANFEALYMDKIDTAIVILEYIINLGDINKQQRANAKLDLADYLLIRGDRWESTLLYSQVDKEMKESNEGEQARFRNAMLSYYNGDFEWSQEQFDILKRATSKLISNDAIDMSVFILDNLGLDTTDVPLRLFSESDLLIFQNKFDQAFSKLDEIEERFPEHGLTDDIIYRKANMNVSLKNYDRAVTQYQTVIEKYPEEIRTDNAIFELAELYEQVLNEKDKAQALYEKLFLDYSNSTFAVEARKRFRILRGDEIQ